MRNSIKYLLFLFILFSCGVSAQDTTSRFIIEGAIDKPVGIDWAVLKTYKTLSLDSMAVYNHAMSKKGTLRSIKGVLLKDILSRVSFNEKLPRRLSEFYIVCTAVDGYKVVFSWNEIFNNPTGSQVMIVVEKNGSSFINQEDGIALISPADMATGRRYVKGLSRITVLRVD